MVEISHFLCITRLPWTCGIIALNVDFLVLQVVFYGLEFTLVQGQHKRKKSHLPAEQQ
jgi:hypothetical protein